ncbi:MAG: polyprenyl synthetase family protein [Myxococcaceae bacterium]|nr:polyprenyl synthetase family protein [Myxococcaceae bacterium]
MDTFAAFKPFLTQVETEIVAQLGGETPKPEDTLVAAARHLCLKAGKRARPMLVKIFGDTLGVPEHKLLVPAVAAELIHASSLLHDDVVDNGMFRRGKPTVNARWGNIVAVMSGDLLLSGALLELSKFDGRLAQAALSVVAEMTRAAIDEVQARGNLELTLDGLKAIGEGKTGSLFGFCGVAAALVGGDEEAVRRFDAFGRRIGVAFQMADDIRDISGTDEGKPQYADLQSRTPNLPVILAVQRDPRLKKRIAEAWGWTALTQDKVKELGTAVLVTGALDDATALMNQEIDAAVDALGAYAQRESGANLVMWARTIARGIALKGAA